MATSSASRTATARSSSTATAAGSGGSPPLCSGHQQPCARLICKNGNNSGRAFWKCAEPHQQQCRFFKWDSPSSAANATPNTPSTPSRPSPSTSTARFTGGGHVLGSSAKPPPTASQTSSSSSSSSTQQSLPSQPASVSPNKRRRLSWQNTSPMTLPRPPQTPPMPPHSQSVEEAIDDDFLDDIQDFDEVSSSPPQQDQRRANILNSPSSNNKKSKFTSFGSTAPPTTPKRERETSTLAPAVPVTPKSVGSKPNDKWAEIIGDPDSPFYARRNALNASASGAAAANDVSPASARTSPLFGSGQAAAANGVSDSRDGTIPSIPSAHLTSLSASFTSFASAHNESLAALSKQIETLERQLKAANLKTAYHERNERRLQEETDQLRTNISVLKRENEELKLARY